MRKRTRRILIVFVVLGLIGAGGVGVLIALRSGQQSQNPFERGLRAERAGNFKVAESRYRALLATKPDHPRAFGRLVQVLQKQGKFAEIDEVAKQRCEAAPDLQDGWATQVQMAMRSGRFADAETIARSRAESNPLLLQSTLWRIQDVSDDPRRRLAAAESALRYAQLAENAENRGIAELFAVRTYLDLAETTRSQAAAEELRGRAARLQREGTAQLTRSTATRPNDFARILLARFRLLDPWPEARRGAESDLSLWLGSNLESPQADDVRRDLIRYRLAAGKELPLRAEAESPEESREAYFAIAVELAKPLANYPAYRLFRLLRSFSRANAEAEALQLLAMRDSAERDDLVEIERCRLLLKTKQEGTEAVAQRALELLKRSKDWRVAVLAHDIARAAGEPQAALEALEAHQRAHPAPQLALSLANRLSEDDSRVDEALRLVEDSYAAGSEANMLGPVLAALDRAGPEHVMAFLERRMASAGEEELRYRLVRTLYIARQIAAGKGAGSDGEDWRVIARNDLARCLELPKQATVDSWMNAARLALTLREYRIAGQCAARLIGIVDSGLGRSLSIFAAAAAAKDETARNEFLDALAAGVGGTPDAEWVVPLSEMVRNGKTSLGDFVDALVERVGIDKANPRTLDLLAPLAAATARRELAERAARRLLAEQPDHPVAAVVLGAILLEDKKFEEVLELHDRAGSKPETLAPIAHDQCVRALIALDRVPDAVARGRAYFDVNLRDLQAYISFSLALLADGKKQEALGILTSAPQTDDVRMRRAALLIQLERSEAAEQLLWSICRRRPRTIPAWTLLAQLLADQQRSADLLLPLAEALKSPAIAGSPELTAALLVVKGMANEQSGRTAAAIGDYKDSIARGNRSVIALNNAAWLIYETDRSNLSQAREYVEAALKAAPQHRSVNDTAAHVFLALGEHDRALRCITLACEVAPKNWKYRLTRVRVLAAKGDKDAAFGALDDILAEEPPIDVAQQAKDLRRTIEAPAKSD